MMRKPIALCALALILNVSQAPARDDFGPPNAQQLLNAFGGIVQSAVRQAVQSEWKKLPDAQIACIDQSLKARGSSMSALVDRGILPSDARVAGERASCRNQMGQLVPSPPRPSAQASRYSVYGLALGGKVAFGSLAYREYQCVRSGKFEGFVWCTKSSNDREARGPFKVWFSIMHSQDGTVVYLNRYQEPAYWAVNEVTDDIQRYSRFIGEEPRIIQMPTRPGLPRGTLATWGNVVLEPIAGEELRHLAEGKPLGEGIAIDFIGDFGRSVRQGLPVYRLGGGEGFVWAASYNDSGRGTLRFAAVNASAYSRQTAPSIARLPPTGKPAPDPWATAPPISPPPETTSPPVARFPPSGERAPETWGYAPPTTPPSETTAPPVARLPPSGEPTPDPWAYAPPISPPPETPAPTAVPPAQVPEPTGASAQNAPVTDCDTLAADPDDPQRKALGVSYPLFEQSIPACEGAVVQYPHDARLAYQLGRAYYAAENMRDALVKFRESAELGYAPAHSMLGWMYQNGQGVGKNYIQAVARFGNAADQGFAPAQTNLGWMYENGWGVSQDYAQAVVWYRKAADQGFSAGQYNLATMYERGWGVRQDYTEALTWYRKAAGQGNQKAQLKVTDLSSQIGKLESVENRSSIQMQIEGGIYVVPVLINDAITLNFVVDSGASDVSIPADVVRTLVRTGTLKETDFKEERTYRLADGSTVPSRTFQIRSLKVGNKVLENVTGSIAPMEGSLLLGQSFLNRFNFWSIDNTKHALLLD